MFTMGTKGHDPLQASARLCTRNRAGVALHTVAGWDAQFRVIHRRNDRVAYRDGAVVAEDHVRTNGGELSPHRGGSLQNDAQGLRGGYGHPESAEDGKPQAKASSMCGAPRPHLAIADADL